MQFDPQQLLYREDRKTIHCDLLGHPVQLIAWATEISWFLAWAMVRSKMEKETFCSLMEKLSRWKRLMLLKTKIWHLLGKVFAFCFFIAFWSVTIAFLSVLPKLFMRFPHFENNSNCIFTIISWRLKSWLATFECGLYLSVAYIWVWLIFEFISCVHRVWLTFECGLHLSAAFIWVQLR